MTSMAALASIPERESFLPRVLPALRAQVDVLCVYLNGYDHVPKVVRELADDVVHSATNDGAERKLHWATAHDGLYLSCDDDLLYPADYVQRMRAHVEAWGGDVICTAHGRSYEGTPDSVHDVHPGSIGTFMQTVADGYLINHGGTGVMAWDASRVKVPSGADAWPVRNMADMQLAIWAQRNAVPMFLVPHAATWIVNLGGNDPRSIWRTSMREQHAARGRMLKTHVWYRWEEAA